MVVNVTIFSTIEQLSNKQLTLNIPDTDYNGMWDWTFFNKKQIIKPVCDLKDWEIDSAIYLGKINIKPHEHYS